MKSGLSFGISTKKTANARQNELRVTNLVKDRIRELGYYDQDKNVQVLITELQCNDPLCVPLETLVVVIEGGASLDSQKKFMKWTHKVLKELKEVTTNDVSELPLPLDWEGWIKSQRAELDLSTTTPDKNELLEPDDVSVDLVTKVIMVQKSTAQKQTSDDEKDKEETNQPNTAKNEIISTSNSNPPPNIGVTRVSMVATTTQNVSRTSNTNNASNTSSQNQHTTSNSNITSSGSDMGAEVANTEVTSAAPNILSTDNQPTFKKKKTSSKGSKKLLVINGTADGGKGVSQAPRHEKGAARGPRGCPCCDPDNLDNIVDRMMFLDCPP